VDEYNWTEDQKIELQEAVSAYAALIEEYTPALHEWSAH
jgi:hypothetical protein